MQFKPSRWKGWTVMTALGAFAWLAAAVMCYAEFHPKLSNDWKSCLFFAFILTPAWFLMQCVGEAFVAALTWVGRRLGWAWIAGLLASALLAIAIQGLFFAHN